MTSCAEQAQGHTLRAKDWLSHTGTSNAFLTDKEKQAPNMMQQSQERDEATCIYRPCSYAMQAPTPRLFPAHNVAGGCKQKSLARQGGPTLRARKERGASPYTLAHTPSPKHRPARVHSPMPLRHASAGAT